MAVAGGAVPSCRCWLDDTGRRKESSGNGEYDIPDELSDIIVG